MKTTLILFLLATYAAAPAWADETVVPSATSSDSTFRLKRVALETVGAVAGELAFFSLSFLVLNSAGAFQDVSPPRVPPSVIYVSMPLAAGLGAGLGALAGARLLERRPPVIAALLGGLFGAMWLSATMFVQQTSFGQVPNHFLWVATAMPAACAVVAAELVLGERQPATRAALTVAPLVGPGSPGGLAVAGRF